MFSSPEKVGGFKVIPRDLLFVAVLSKILHTILMLLKSELSVARLRHGRGRASDKISKYYGMTSSLLLLKNINELQPEKTMFGKWQHINEKSSYSKCKSLSTARNLKIMKQSMNFKI